MSRLEKDDKKIRFNLKSFLKRKKSDKNHQKKECSIDEMEEKQPSLWENSIDFHLETVKKIDALIEDHEKEKVFEDVELDSIPEKQPGDFLKEEHVGIKESLDKKAEISSFEIDAHSKDIFSEKDIGTEEVLLDVPVITTPGDKFVTALHQRLENILGIKLTDVGKVHTKDKDFHSQLMGDYDVTVQKKSASLQKVLHKKEPLEESEELQISPTKETLEEPKNLSEKAQQKKQKTVSSGKKAKELHIKDKEELNEQTGLGWKGLGCGRIVFDSDLKEYVYNVIEPQLKKEEEEIKNKVVHLFRISADVDVFGMDASEKIKCLEKALQKIIDDNRIKLDEESKDKIFYYIFREFVGYGKIDVLMHDEGVEDISCDGHGIPVFVYHRDYESIRANMVFDDVDELDSFVVKLAQICDKQISVYEPIVDGRLPDGSRLQITLAKTVTQQSTFTIRRFRADPFTPIDLIDNNTMSVEMAAYFWLAVESGASILFCGGTATGKTSALNAFSLFIPPSYKIVSIEDTREINLPHINWIAGTTREGFSASEKTKTAKDIDMFDLIRTALRQRPRVIIVGEVRGREANTLFQAMATGHISYSTVHASDMHELLQRLENSPISLPRALLTSLDIVVFLSSVTIQEKPVRRISKVVEIIKLDTSTNRLVFMAPFSWISEIDDRFKREERSVILGKIKTRKGWNDERLSQELTNRIHVLEWMRRKNLRSYGDVGKIVSEYSKDPEAVLKRVTGEST